MTSNVVHIGAFLVAVAATVIPDGLTTAASAAILLSAIGVLIAATIEVPFRGRQGVVLVTVTVMLYSIAMGLTGGVTSAFALMPVAAIFLAAVAGGATAATTVAVVSVVGFMLSAWLEGNTTSVEALIRAPAIYVITAIAFSEVQRALRAESDRAAELVTATTASQSRAERLEATHDLLEDLMEVATSPDVNAVAAAHDSLRDVGVILPTTPARIVTATHVTLAFRGQLPPTPPTDVVSIARNGRELATLELWGENLTLAPSQRAAIEVTVAPVAIALENDDMVQRLAGITIQRERVRLARELHDDVAPSIASVGLALDMVLMADHVNDDDRRTLEATRSNVTRLVDRIRSRVQDLRADRSVSIVEMANGLIAEVDADGPTVVLDVDERTPPRPAIALEVGALLTEAFRNAVGHGDPTIISIAGRVDDDEGRITIEDDGVGFVVDDAGTGRYGLVGMRERAALIGADLTIRSSPGDGTTVTLQWSDST